MFQSLGRAVLVPIGLLAAGTVVLLAAGDDTAGFAVGFALIGLAGILLVSLVFYAVGRSEDLDRERERRRLRRRDGA